MRILFAGAVHMSRALLERLVSLRADLAGVACKPTSKVHADFSSLDDIARAADIPLHHTMSLNDPQTRTWICARKPDVVFCCGWSELLDPSFLGGIPKGVVGYHPAMLPRHRGRHPIIWALALGLTETGSTFFLMDEGADSGPILSQRRVLIGEGDDAGDLYRRLIAVACDQVEDVWRGLRAGTLEAAAQDHARATYWRKRTPDDGQIDWRMPTRGICNLIRALAKPYPGATFGDGAGRTVVWRARAASASAGDVEPGRILAVIEGAPRVKTGDGAVDLIEIAPQRPFNSGEVL